MPCTNSNKMELIAFIFIVILGELLDIPPKGKHGKISGTTLTLTTTTTETAQCDFSDRHVKYIHITASHIEVKRKSPT